MESCTVSVTRWQFKDTVTSAKLLLFIEWKWDQVFDCRGHIAVFKWSFFIKKEKVHVIWNCLLTVTFWISIRSGINSNNRKDETTLLSVTKSIVFENCKREGRLILETNTKFHSINCIFDDLQFLFYVQDAVAAPRFSF